MSADSELAQDLRALKEHNKQKRREYLARRLEYLKSEGIPFSTNNGGVHCTVQVGIRTYDVWPSTNRWRLRGGIKSFFGMPAFVHEYRKHAPATVLDEQTAFVERMERAYPHLKGEQA